MQRIAGFVLTAKEDLDDYKKAEERREAQSNRDDAGVKKPN